MYLLQNDDQMYKWKIEYITFVVKTILLNHGAI